MSLVFEERVVMHADRANPDDSKIRILGGAGTLSLKALKLKARKEALQLAVDIEAATDESYRIAAYNVRQLKNTLDTLAAALEELNDEKS